ncbi:HEPACAM family member 2 isoform X2 [Rhinatrema bivittatum]|uniref:HEPACAM family member 2 isoform X2 n=1 Tax=Rhinatrema bivittatum TaxID=194408 RepID=UPI001127D4B8|nr:HEPACAM family member 2 isoform X2 [Rhinatrema bivittatum]XP_029444753.1 HEPACAM family member 2 isoform X2 [Rhinatrema bivittatum]
MGQDAFMESFSKTFCFLKCKIYFLLLGTCSTFTLKVPSHTVHGIEGEPLVLPVHYDVNTTASEIQIIWMLARPQSFSRYLLSSVNKSVVPDFEYQPKFTLIPLNASLLINPLSFSDEGNYIVKVNVKGNGMVSAQENIQVTVNVPVSKPVIRSEPTSGAVEHVGNITITCSVRKGTRITYQWLKNGQPVTASPSYSFSLNNDTLFIAPVMKDDIGNYSCLAKNPVSEMESDPITPTIYYGPYGLTVNSDKGLKVGEVFTVDIGEDILFACSADSNPPNIYSWIRRADNTTHIVKYGPHFEVASDKVTQKTTDYLCQAYNNVTGKRDEMQFTVIITSIVDHEKLVQKGNALSPLAAITGISLFLIFSMSLLFLWKRYHLHKVIQQKLERRPATEYKKTQIFSGHEDALDDFGIYEFVSFPDNSVPPKSYDVHGTVYEVIQHIPEQSCSDH